jgi:hypothetical protein
MRTIAILIFLTIKIFGQQSCNLDKYSYSTKAKVDSTATLKYYTDDNKFYIAYKKRSTDSLIKYIFDNRVLNFQALVDIAANSVIVGSPDTNKDETGKIKFYSELDEKYLDTPTYTYIVDKVTLTPTSKKSFVINVKVSSGRFNQNFELKYHSKKPTKKYKTVADKLNNSTLTCIRFAGTDY